MDIHQKIKLARMMSGLRQSDLADELGIKQSVIARYEAGGGRVPRTDAVHQIAKATGWPTKWFENDRLEGLIVTTLTLPHIAYSETALATIERVLSSMLPDLFALPAFTDAKVCCLEQEIKGKVHTSTEQVYLIFTNELCIVIFPSQRLNSFAGKVIKSKFDITFKPVPSELLIQQLWRFPYYDEFAALLKTAQVPEKLISLAEGRLPPEEANKKLTIEITPPPGMHVDIIKAAVNALEKELFIVHSIKLS